MTESQDAQSLPPNFQVAYRLLVMLQDSRPRMPKDVYDPIADFYKLTSQQRSARRATTSGKAWHNRVQTARGHLVRRGLMNRKPFGLWSLTEAGRMEAKRLHSLIGDDPMGSLGME